MISIQSIEIASNVSCFGVNSTFTNTPSTNFFFNSSTSSLNRNVGEPTNMSASLAAARPSVNAGALKSGVMVTYNENCDRNDCRPINLISIPVKLKPAVDIVDVVIFSVVNDKDDESEVLLRATVCNSLSSP